MEPLRVLFLCTGNSARSQMAEALLRLLSRERIDVHSAGTNPATEVHPVAIDVLGEHFHVDTRGLHPKPISRFVGETFDYVITVCDRANEACPVFPGDPERIHWSFDDPAAVTESAAQRRAFEAVANGLAARIRIWMALPSIGERLAPAHR
jgi:protein-tyrosine-phosphatase